MGNAQTRESGFISAGANGDTSYVRQAMQTDTTARERLLSAHTGFFSGKKTILHVAAETGKADVVASGGHGLSAADQPHEVLHKSYLSLLGWLNMALCLDYV